MKLLRQQTKKLVILKEENNMIFLENVRKRYTVKKGNTEQHLLFDLHAQIGECIKGNGWLDVPNKWPFILTIDECDHELDSDNLTAIAVNLSLRKHVISGLIYMSTDDVKEFKKDPYKFCVKNDILEGDEETRSDADETSTDQEVTNDGC